ncbi:PREDICTED: sialic acid-binding Ig-like lectin 8-like [Elephantulus edwardii]|uniref:sialic acid-binding Ig-like lectin 8-like n=1 Tax=Elephantulus edwardii TaxID=28737 RepID=UPI0003F070C1|nr:PREDICTED: sialic acid-binding Ig-like lectin 8-like [Elephantulus edwardii]
MLLLLLPLLLGRDRAEGQAREHGNEFRLQVQSPQTVQAGLHLHVPCTVKYPRKDWIDSDPAYGFWFRKGAHVLQDLPVATNLPGVKVQKETRGRFLLLGDLRENNCSLDIRDVRMKDAGSYFFRLERGRLKYTYLLPELSVNVTALTQTPKIHIQRSLESGKSTEIACKVPWACKKGTLPTFSWIGVALTSLDPKTLRHSVLSFTPKPHHHGTNLTCQVTFPGAGVTTESTIQLNVSYAPQNVTIGLFWENGTGSEALSNNTPLPVLEGQFLRLICTADSNPPPTLSWARENRTLSPPKLLHPGILELPYVKLGDQGKYICKAENTLGSLAACLILSVNSSPLDHPNSAAAEPTSNEGLELHYACVNFQEVKKPWNSAEQESTDATEYSEIKIQKFVEAINLLAA